MATRTPLLNYYEILGVARGASLRDIEAAYRARVVAARDKPGGAEETRRINLAYRALSDPDRRRDYDAALGGLPASSMVAAGAGAFIARPAEAEIDPPAGAQVPRPAEAQPQVTEPPASEVEEGEEPPEDEASPHRPWTLRRIALLAVAAGLMLVVALLGSTWLQREEPQVAATSEPVSGQVNGPGGTAAAQATAEDRGWFGETLEEVASLGRGQAQPEGGETQEIAAAAPPVASPTVPSENPDTREGAITEQTSEAAPERVADAGTTQPSAESDEPASAQNAQVAPAPPPPNRSAPARLISGGLYDSDNRGGQYVGSVGVRLFIGTNGRVQSCRVNRSSGNGDLDSTTCRLLSERLVFSPALDRDGTPVSTTVDGTHVWGQRRRR